MEDLDLRLVMLTDEEREALSASTRVLLLGKFKATTVANWRLRELLEAEKMLKEIINTTSGYRLR